MKDDMASRLYAAFDPRPLGPEDTDLYVELDDLRGSIGLVAQMERRIRLSDRPTCQILAGHRGSGKSTELARLEKTLEEGESPYFVVYCRMDDDVDRNDVDLPEVLIGIVRHMAEEVDKRLGMKPKPGYFRDRISRLKQLFLREIDLEKFDLGVSLLKISGSIKSSPEARTAIREALEPDAGNWIEAANDFVDQIALNINKKQYKGLVVIVDDLDKMVLRAHPKCDCSTAEYLFVHRAEQLTALRCHLIYTMPLALAYSSAESTIANLYGSYPPVVSMTKISTQPPEAKPFEQGIERFERLTRARIIKAGARQEDMFATEEVLRSLVMLSGGQPRELMILMREAMVSSDMPISQDAVARAKREGRIAYLRQLRADHWPIIEDVRKTGTLPRDTGNDAAIRELLDSRAILQYRNEVEWYAVNPFLADASNPFVGGQSV